MKKLALLVMIVFALSVKGQKIKFIGSWVGMQQIQLVSNPFKLDHSVYSNTILVYKKFDFQAGVIYAIKPKLFLYRLAIQYKIL